MRMNLFATVSVLATSAAEHEAWERAISDFAAGRHGQSADSLHPLTVGRATLASAVQPTTAGPPGPRPRLVVSHN